MNFDYDVESELDFDELEEIQRELQGENDQNFQGADEEESVYLQQAASVIGGDDSFDDIRVGSTKEDFRPVEDERTRVFSLAIEEFHQKLRKTDYRKYKIEEMREILEEFRKNWTTYIKLEDSRYGKPDFEIFDDSIIAVAVSEVNVFYHIEPQRKRKGQATDYFSNNIIQRYLKGLSDFLHEKKDKGITQDKYYIKGADKKILFTFTGAQFRFCFRISKRFDHLRLALINSYTKLKDPRFSQMAGFLTFWAKSRGLFDGDEILQPTALYLMIIYFLKIQKPQLLPDLYIGGRETQEIKIFHTKSLQLSHKVDIGYDFELRNRKIYEEKQAKNEDSIGSLVAKFFYTFWEQIPKESMLISLREFKRKERFKTEDEGYMIQDPFIEGWMLYRNLRKGTARFKLLHWEFGRAFRFIKGTQKMSPEGDVLEIIDRIADLCSGENE